MSNSGIANTTKRIKKGKIYMKILIFPNTSEGLIQFFSRSNFWVEENKKILETNKTFNF